MSHHLFDLPLLFQIVQRLPSQTSVDLKSVDQGGHGDKTVRLDIFVKFVRGGFIKDNGMVGLILYCW